MVIDCTSLTTITASGTNIVSQEGHPSTNYADNLDCQLAFDLSLVADRKITIKFTAFNLELGRVSCPYDWVRFWTGADSSGAEIGTKRCGSTIPTTIQADTNKVYMRFKTDVSVTRSGFRIQMIGENYSYMINS